VRVPVLQSMSAKRGGLLSSAPNLLCILGLAAVYFCTAKLGLAMAFDAAQVTVVWPPTGIALTAILLLGYRAWPGILLGAFLANVTTHEPITTALGIGLGNTLEAVAGAWLLQRAGFDTSLRRVRDVLCLFIYSALLSTMVSATIGVTSLCLGYVQPWDLYGKLWWEWWLGDATGSLMCASLLLVWCSGRTFNWSAAQIKEASILMAGLILVSVAILSPLLNTENSVMTYKFIIFPFIVWAALRFGQRGTTATIIVASAIAIGGILQHVGVSSIALVNHDLVVLQFFMIIMTATGLLLAAAVAEREEIAKELRIANHRKDNFLALLSHELRNPLAPIISAAHTLQLPTIGAERRREAQDIIIRHADHMTHLVDDLLDVSRISHGKIELRKQHVSLAKAIADAVETVKPSIDAHGHTLTLQLPPKPIWLNADPTRIAQIFANLLGNATKYTPPGGQIWLGTEADENTVTVRVRDTGIGIAKNMVNLIFEPFMQVDSSIERSHGGLGIGLALVRKLVGLHEGSVQVISEGVGRGSEFIIRLPRILHDDSVKIISETAPPKSELPTKKPQVIRPEIQVVRPEISAPVAPIAQNNTTKSSLRVLVVDDNEILAKTFSWMLEILGHEVRFAHDAETALATALEFLPDVLMLDIGLPKVNGYELCQTLRAQPALKHSLFIAQTGWGQSEHRARSKAAGFDYHLVKPVDISVLEQLFSSLHIPKTPT